MIGPSLWVIPQPSVFRSPYYQQSFLFKNPKNSSEFDQRRRCGFEYHDDDHRRARPYWPREEQCGALVNCTQLQAVSASRRARAASKLRFNSTPATLIPGHIPLNWWEITLGLSISNTIDRVRASRQRVRIVFKASANEDLQVAANTTDLTEQI